MYISTNNFSFLHIFSPSDILPCVMSYPPSILSYHIFHQTFLFFPITFPSSRHTNMMGDTFPPCPPLLDDGPVLRHPTPNYLAKLHIFPQYPFLFFPLRSQQASYVVLTHPSVKPQQNLSLTTSSLDPSPPPLESNFFNLKIFFSQSRFLSLVAAKRRHGDREEMGEFSHMIG